MLSFVFSWLAFLEYGFGGFSPSIPSICLQCPAFSCSGNSGVRVACVCSLVLCGGRERVVAFFDFRVGISHVSHICAWLAWFCFGSVVRILVLGISMCCRFVFCHSEDFACGFLGLFAL